MEFYTSFVNCRWRDKQQAVRRAMFDAVLFGNGTDNDHPERLQPCERNRISRWRTPGPWNTRQVF